MGEDHGEAGIALSPLTVKTLGQAVQVVGHGFKVLADRGALFGLPGAVITELGNTGDLLIDVFSHMTLFFRRRSHLLAHSGNPGDGLTDADQRRLHRLDTLHAFAGHLLATAGR
ncbi:hypothetical protein D3C75_384670 [compost metagenome]